MNPEGSKSEKQPEIKLEELMIVIDSVRWENHYKFSYNGSDYNLFIIDREIIEKGEGGQPAEFFPSTEIRGGWDIYLHDTISMQDRKRILFHEILETNFLTQGFPESDVHDMVLVEEEKIFGKRKK